MTDLNQKYWGSLEELADSESFKEGHRREFLAPPQEQVITEMERRNFLKIMGAGLLFATAACSRKPVEKIIPYVNRPLEITPGVPTWYASTCQTCSTGCGVLVKTREGRPIKIEGNPEHPLNRGGLCARGQASLLDLYDPDRLKNPVLVNAATYQDVSWEELDTQVKSKLANSSGVYLLTGIVNSPSSQKAINQFLATYPGAKHVAFDPLAPQAVAVAQEKSYGKKLIPQYRFDRAQFILSFGADFLGTWISPVEFTKQYAAARNPDSKTFARFVCVESGVSLTGTNADDRYGIKPGHEVLVALAVLNSLITRQKLSADSFLSGVARAYTPAKVAEVTGLSAEEIEGIAADLAKNRGNGLVVGGPVNAKWGVELEVVVNAINSLLQNDGNTVDYSVATQLTQNDPTEFLKNLKAGNVQTLLIADINPAFDWPSDWGFAEAVKKVSLVVRLSASLDETAMLSHVVAPTPHSLESWGDANPKEGLFSIVQPTIAPLYSTRPFEESLLRWSNDQTLWHDYIQNNWKSAILKGGSWEEALEKGYYQASASSNSRGAPRLANSQVLSSVSLPSASENFALQLYPSIAMGDGRQANNGWLQELPDPISKITWDNYLSVSPDTAQQLRLQTGDVVRVEGEGFSAEVPVNLQPGLHHHALTLALGYGRTKAGRVGNGVGFNVQSLPRFENGLPVWSGLEVKSLVKTGARYELAGAQTHHTIDQPEREHQIIQDTTWHEMKEGHSAHEGHEEMPITMWPLHEFPKYRWGMAIDMNSCTGCSACVIGCQSENNIPTVGKEQVLVGREMHWLRIDRYYKGTPQKPKVAFQPMLCQHCENAPCETVCPVLATVHDDEGLNEMIYNRCVGTRYCSNNCPYKVRRFNYFDYSENIPAPKNLALNPDISVRSQGVMEKCNFCIQRIRYSKDQAKSEGRLVKDGEIKTACQQSCPSDAIVFGNINDPQSRVSQLQKSKRGYRVLEELNVRSQITYLKKVRNIEA